MAVQLYGFWRSNASFRVRVALNLKQISFDEQSVDILNGEQHGSAFDRINPAHALPALVHDGQVLTQSLAIIEYLDEIQPEPPLLPRDAVGRARARALAMVSAADAHPLIVPRVRKQLAQQFGASPEQVHAWGRHWTEQGLATYQRLLSEAPPAPYALGETPGLADICIAGQLVMADLFDADAAAFPAVKGLGDKLFALPAFAHARIKPKA